MEEAWVGGALDASLRPLRKVMTAALPGLRLGPGWCSRPVSLSHCLMEKLSRRDATLLVSLARYPTESPKVALPGDSVETLGQGLRYPRSP